MRITRGGLLGLDRADLGDRDLEVGQDLEQVRLELLVGAVDLVDEQDRRDAVVRLERLEERPADQEVRAEDVVRVRPLGLAAGLEQADLEHLARVVPLVDGRVDVQALVALEPDEPGAEAGREDLRELGLADAGLALEQQRAPELQREEHGRGQRAVRDVVAAAEVLGQRLDGARAGGTLGAVGGGSGIGHAAMLHGRPVAGGRRGLNGNGPTRPGRPGPGRRAGIGTAASGSGSRRDPAWPRSSPRPARRSAAGAAAGPRPWPWSTPRTWAAPGWTCRRRGPARASIPGGRGPRAAPPARPALRWRGRRRRADRSRRNPRSG